MTRSSMNSRWSGGKDEDRQARGAESDCVTRLGAVSLGPRFRVLSARAGQQFGLQRNDALFERASTIASRDILRTDPFPSVDNTSSFRDLEVSLSAESERIGAEMRRLTALQDEALAQLRPVHALACPTTSARDPLRDLSRDSTALRNHPLDACRAYSGFRLRYVACDGERRQLYMHADLASPLPLKLHDSTDRNGRVQNLLSLPPKCTTRWGQLSLTLKRGTLDRELQPDLFSLERANVHLLGSTHPERELLMVFSQAPALLALAIHMPYDLFFGDSPEFRSPPLPRLTDLTLSARGTVADIVFFPILAQCAGTLERLTLVSEPASPDFPLPKQPIVCPRLNTLSLQYTAHRYLCHLDTPALASLAVRDSCGAHAGAVASLRRLLAASNTCPPIQALLLHRVGAPDPEDFLQCLERLPGLTSLRIARAPDDSVPWHVLVRLACTDLRTPLVPRLTAFSLRYARGRVPEKLQRALWVMLRSRAVRKVLRGVEVEALQSVETDLDAGALCEEGTRNDEGT
ncbi:uncharacterized protein SCHCODRAFT_02570877 [Schizophyllum commune H4-8]|nr:uncharacterized protein SCHCODRAFT_02570877 [Schizophyllum commune H4-8]KAI5897257.1 hypothetical protein SCHCODRAFT_02570877 [Schizophyllum commune H4-8]